MTITELFDPYNQLSINMQLVAKLGLSEAVMFSILCAKYNEVKNAGLLHYDMFICSVEEIRNKTGLSYHKQIKALDNLEKVNLVNSIKDGMPAKKYFKINQRELLEFLQTTEIIDFTAFLNNQTSETLINTDNSSKNVPQSTDFDCFQIFQNQSLYNNISNNPSSNTKGSSNNIYNNTRASIDYREKHGDTHLEDDLQELEQGNDVLERLKKELSMQGTKEKRGNHNRRNNGFIGSANIKDDSKQNRYQQYAGIIYKFSDDLTNGIADVDRRTIKRKEIQEALFMYLNMLLEDSGGRKTLYTSVFKGMLAKLSGLVDRGEDVLEVIQQSIDRGYRSFYPINQGFKNQKTEYVPNEQDLIDEIANASSVNDGSQDVTDLIY